MESIHVQAIILRYTPYLEYDGIIQILTKQHGKISILAKGIQRQKSKNKGCLRCFSYIECDILLPQKNTGLGKLIRMNPIQAFLSEDTLTQTIFSIIAESTCSLLPKEINSQQYIFEKWRELLQNDITSINTIFWFLLHIYKTMGVLPSFTHPNNSCEKFGNQKTFYWSQEEGINTTSSQQGDIPISFPLLKFCNFISSHTLDNISNIKLSSLQKKELWNIIWGIYSYYADFFPRSKKIYESLYL